MGQLPPVPEAPDRCAHAWRRITNEESTEVADLYAMLEALSSRHGSACAHQAASGNDDPQHESSAAVAASLRLLAYVLGSASTVDCT